MAGGRKMRKNVPLIITQPGTVAAVAVQKQPNGMLGVVVTQAWPITPVPQQPPSIATVLAPNELNVIMRWYYTRKGVEAQGRKTVRMYFHAQDLAFMVHNIADFIRESEWPGERQNARLEIHEEDRYRLNGRLLYDLRCSVRVMNRVKKRFPYING